MNKKRLLPLKANYHGPYHRAGAWLDRNSYTSVIMYRYNTWLAGGSITRVRVEFRSIHLLILPAAIIQNVVYYPSTTTYYAYDVSVLCIIIIDDVNFTITTCVFFLTLFPAVDDSMEVFAGWKSYLVGTFDMCQHLKFSVLLENIIEERNNIILLNPWYLLLKYLFGNRLPSSLIRFDNRRIQWFIFEFKIFNTATTLPVTSNDELHPTAQ